MIATIDRAALSRVLAASASVADRKSTLPVLSCARMEARDGAVEVVATDLAVTVIASVPADVRTAGAVVLAAAVVSAYIKALDGERVRFEQTKGNVLIEAGSARFKLIGLAPSDYPRVERPTGESHTIEAPLLATLIRAVEPAVSSDWTRETMTGVHLVWCNDSFRVESTDGHRAHRRSAKIAGGPVVPLDVLIPRVALPAILRLLDGGGQARICVTKEYVFVTVGDATVSAKLTDATFPVMDHVWPRKFNHVVSVKTDVLLPALRRVMLAAEKQFHAAKITVGNGRMEIVSENPDLGEAHDGFDVADTGSKLLTIGVTLTYLIDSVNCSPNGEIYLSFGRELDPIAVSATDYAALVMPLRP